MFGGFGDAGSARPIGCQRFFVQLDDKVHFWGANVDVTGSEAYAAGQWQMLTATYDGTTVRVYRNGREIVASEETFTAAAFQAHLVPPNHWNKGEGPYFVGLLDDFRIWRGALSEAQIAELAQSLPEREEIK
jgi:alpha-mannosidase